MNSTNRIASSFIRNLILDGGSTAVDIIFNDFMVEMTAKMVMKIGRGDDK